MSCFFSAFYSISLLVQCDLAVHQSSSICWYVSLLLYQSGFYVAVLCVLFPIYFLLRLSCWSMWSSNSSVYFSFSSLVPFTSTSSRSSSSSSVAQFSFHTAASGASVNTCISATSTVIRPATTPEALLFGVNEAPALNCCDLSWRPHAKHLFFRRHLPPLSH